MATKKELQEKISDLKAGIESGQTPDNLKAKLRDLLKKTESELSDLEKADTPAEKKEVEKKAETTLKKVEKAVKDTAGQKKSAKSILDNCRELLSKHRKDNQVAAKRIEKRKKAGKPAELTPSETVSKTAKAVSSKVVSIKERTDKGLSSGELNKLSSGIVATIKATLKGILGAGDKKVFLNDLVDEINSLKSELPKAAEMGGSVDFENDGAGMFKMGGGIDNNMMVGTYFGKDAVKGNVSHIAFFKAENGTNIELVGKRDSDSPTGMIFYVAINGRGLYAREYREDAYELYRDEVEKYNKKYAKGGYNTGRSWHQDRARYNKAESWERPLNQRKGRYEDGGVIVDYTEGLFADPRFDINSPSFEAGGNVLTEDTIGRVNDPSFSDVGQYRGGGMAAYYEKKKEDGGAVNSENAEMLVSQVKEIKHHTDEILDLIKSQNDVEAWVIAKAERSSTDLSDIYHYLDGRKDMFCCGGSLEHGGSTNSRHLNTVRVKFANPEYNYETNVNADVSEQDVRKYFVGNMFDVGVYPVENMQKVVDIDFIKKDNYFLVGSTENKRINEMVGHYIRYGWAGSNIKNDDSKFFEKIGQSPMETASTSFTGTDIKYYNPKKVFVGVGGFIPIVYDKGGKNGSFTDFYLVVNLDERGLYSADVRNPMDEIVYSIGSSEEMNQMIEDGFLKYKADEDLNRLTKYLMDMDFIPNGSQIYSEEEFDDKIRDQYAKGGETDQKMIQLWYVTDNQDRVKNISKSVEQAEVFLADKLGYSGNINYVKVPLSDWESEKVNVGNIKQIAKSFWQTYRKGGQSKSYISGDEFREKLENMSDEELLQYYVDENGFDIEDSDHKQRIDEERDSVIDELVDDYVKMMESTGRFYAKGGNVMTKIKDIPNLEDKIKSGMVTYRGIGFGQSGKKIKVDGVEYLISDDEFNKIGRDKQGNLRIRFSAPTRKLYAKGGKSKSYISGDEFREKLENMSDEELLQYYVDENGFDIEDSDHKQRIDEERDSVIDELVDDYVRMMKSTGRFYAKGGGVDDLEEGDIVMVKSSKLKGEVTNVGTDYVTIEYIGKRPEGGDKIGTFKSSKLKLIVEDDEEEYAKGGGIKLPSPVQLVLKGKKTDVKGVNFKVYELNGIHYALMTPIKGNQYVEIFKGKMYSNGGGVKFKDKVEAIKKSLLARKKVPKSVQKDYGKTFSKAEAEDSAKRIAGAMRKKEMSKK